MMKKFKLVLLLPMIAILGLACSDSSENNDELVSSPLIGTWRAVTIQISETALTQRSPDNENVIISFDSGGTFEGNTSSNTFTGRFETLASTLTMLEFESTEMADTPFAGIFFNAISAAIIPDDTIAQFGFSFDSQNLILVFGNSGEIVLERQ